MAKTVEYWPWFGALFPLKLDGQILNTADGGPNGKPQEWHSSMICVSSSELAFRNGPLQCVWATICPLQCIYIYIRYIYICGYIWYMIYIYMCIPRGIHRNPCDTVLPSPGSLWCWKAQGAARHRPQGLLQVSAVHSMEPPSRSSSMALFHGKMGMGQYLWKYHF